MTKLKPCPFCGGQPDIAVSKYGKYVTCPCSLNPRTDAFEDVSKAIEQWNTRANSWHTGTPTEEGWYLIEMKDWEKQRVYYVPDYVSVHDLVLPTVQSFYESHLWQKIEPSDEANDLEHKITPLKADKEKI